MGTDIPSIVNGISQLSTNIPPPPPLSLSILRAMEADTHLCNTISLCDTVPLLPTHLHPKRPFYQIVTSEE